MGGSSVLVNLVVIPVQTAVFLYSLAKMDGGSSRALLADRLHAVMRRTWQVYPVMQVGKLASQHAQPARVASHPAGRRKSLVGGPKNYFLKTLCLVFALSYAFGRTDAPRERRTLHFNEHAVDCDKVYPAPILAAVF